MNTTTFQPESVLQAIADTLNCARGDLAPETTLEDLPDWDSLNQLRILLAIESTQSATLPMRRFQSCRSVGDVVELVRDVRAGATARLP
ncbi:MAG TPA: acyl carrier protein [Burkholderiaceae bacterium]